MDKTFELINALNALTKAVGALTEKITSEYLNTFETIYDPAEDEPQTAEAPKEQSAPEKKTETVTFVQLRSRLSEISRTGHTQEVKELITRYGADKLSDIAEADYAAVLAEAEKLV